MLFAETPAEASELVVRIAKHHQVKLVTKSKSMVSEEMALNKALEAAGVTPVETDLGEYILQINDNEPPSHIIAPVIHKDKEEIADLFAKVHNKPRLTDIPEMTREAREMLRPHFLSADMGVTGGNFIIAESGSVAVVVNYRADGKAWKPLSDADMTKLNALVKDAVGFDAKRGDSVNVVNSQFSGTLPVAKDDLPLWKQPDMIQYAIQGAKYLALAIGFLILVFGVIRPAIRSMGKKPEPATPTFVGREGEDPNAPIITGAAAPAGPGLEGPTSTDVASEELPDALPQLKNNDFDKKLETMRRVAQQNPRAVAAVIKQWVNNE